jgi:hypothetical protein
MNIIQRFPTEEKENFGGNTKDGTKLKSRKTWKLASLKKKEYVNNLKNCELKVKIIKNLKQETRVVKMKKTFNKTFNQKILKICKLKAEENNMRATVKEEERKLKVHSVGATKC